MIYPPPVGQCLIRKMQNKKKLFSFSFHQRGTLSQKERDALALYNLVPKELDFANVDQVTNRIFLFIIKFPNANVDHVSNHSYFVFKLS